MRKLVCSCIVVALGACASESPSAPGLITVATWNAERVFDEVCDTGTCGASEAEDVRTRSEADADAARVARGVRALDADLVVLEEIENRAMLERIIAAYGELPTAVIGESGPGTIDVAILSRFPLLSVTEQRPSLALPGRDSVSTRVFLEAHLDAGARRLIVLGVHFKSKLRDDAARRHAEADAAGALVRAASARYPDALVVLAGDLNDTLDSPTLEILEGDHALEAVTRTHLPAGAYSFGTGTRGSLIDHVLLVPRTFARVQDAVIVRSEGGPLAGSDHAGVRVTFGL